MATLDVQNANLVALNDNHYFLQIGPQPNSVLRRTAVAELGTTPLIHFTPTTITVSSGVGTIPVLTDKTIYRFSAPLSQLVISSVASSWTNNSMAHLVLTWASSLNVTPLNYGSSGISAFDSTVPVASKPSEISIFNNKAKLFNGE